MPFPEAFRRQIQGHGPAVEQLRRVRASEEEGGDHLAFLLRRRAQVFQQLDDLWNSGELSLLVKQKNEPMLLFVEAALELYVLATLHNPSTSQVGLICHYLEIYFEALLEEPSVPQLPPSEVVSLAVAAAMSSSGRRAASRGSFRRSSRGGSGQRHSSAPRNEDDVVSELLLGR